MPHKKSSPVEFAEVCAFAMQQEVMTVATIQRKFVVGHDVALRLLYRAERVGIIGSPDHEGKRVRAGVRRLLFLDFDGVLHTSSTPPFSLSHILADALGEQPCSIVVSSSWRFGRTVSNLSEVLPPHLANRVTAATGEVAIGRYARHQEIQRFLKGEVETPRWIAVDDSVADFPDRSDLLACDPSRGFGHVEADMLREWIAAYQD